MEEWDQSLEGWTIPNIASPTHLSWCSWINVSHLLKLPGGTSYQRKSNRKNSIAARVKTERWLHLGGLTLKFGEELHNPKISPNITEIGREEKTRLQGLNGSLPAIWNSSHKNSFFMSPLQDYYSLSQRITQTLCGLFFPPKLVQLKVSLLEFCKGGSVEGGGGSDQLPFL